MSDDEKKYVEVLAKIFGEYGLPPEWGPAIAKVESGFNPKATNLTGGDLARGGAWGLCQLTLSTARALGYQGATEGLCDPKINGLLAAELCAQLARRYKYNLHDVAAAYNSGKPYAKAPLVSQKYAQSVVKNAALYQYRPEVLVYSLHAKDDDPVKV